MSNEVNCGEFYAVQKHRQECLCHKAKHRQECLCYKAKHRHGCLCHRVKHRQKCLCYHEEQLHLEIPQFHPSFFCFFPAKSLSTIKAAKRKLFATLSLDRKGWKRMENHYSFLILETINWRIVFPFSSINSVVFLFNSVFNSSITA